MVSPAPRSRGEAGYNLVILMVAITVMNIVVAMALPLWRTAIRRDKEEELIFRGFQYAEAIRVFQHRYGRLPVRLEELVEVKPRCIRQLWEDPITGKEDWVPIRVGMPGTVPPPNQPQQPGAPPPDKPPAGDQGGAGNQGDGGNPNGDEAQGGAQGPDGTVAMGPIRGVRSRAHGTALKTLFGQSHYDQWQFTIDALGVVSSPVPGVGVPSRPVLWVRWVGRPFRPGISGPPSGTGPMPNQPPGVPGAPGVGVPQPKPQPPAEPPPPPDDNPDGGG